MLNYCYFKHSRDRDMIYQSLSNKNTFDRSEQMYSAIFRSAPIESSSIGDEDELEYIIEEITKSIVNSIALKRGILKSDDDDLDYYHSLLSDIYSECELPPTFLFVDLVNYKGECIGYSLYETARNKPLFVSKDMSRAEYEA